MWGATFFFYYTLFHFSVLSLREPEMSEKNSFPFSDSREKKILIVDTDAGADDGVAILNLLGSEKFINNVEIMLITTVLGNTNVDNVGRNVLKVLDTVNRLDIPVYKGSNQSLLKTPKSENFFGEDGFGDFKYPNPPSEDLIETRHAVWALIEEVNLNPGQLTLVCLGPLTNIALAIKLDNQFLNKVKDVYILGGSDSGVGNIKPGVEFNFYMDPDAAFIVLNEAEKINKILNLVTWETAFERSEIEMDWRKNVLGAIESPTVELINNAERLTLSGEKWISSDTILSSILIDDDIIESSDVYNGVVETSGEHSRGALFIDFNNSNNSNKNIRIIKKINTIKHKRMLLQNFGSVKVPNNGASRL